MGWRGRGKITSVYYFETLMKGGVSSVEKTPGAWGMEGPQQLFVFISDAYVAVLFVFATGAGDRGTGLYGFSP